MHGPGYGPPQPRPSGAGAIVLRVLFALLPLLSIGMLSWTALLRLAIVTRRGVHWALFWAQLCVFVFFFTFIVAAPDENDWRMDVGMIGLLALAVASTAFFLYADIRHAAQAPFVVSPFGQYGGPAGYGPPHIPGTHIPGATAPQFGPYANPYADTPVPSAPPAPVPPQPHIPAAPRIEQVRAELDELSQYLRKGTEGGAR
ncbi:hypothetical protein ACIBCO_12770 [Streptomyces violascens]|uniref:hypothetical protein n=1 Tax=Streptomyces violascens TaxID=67381 RepID=UPI00378D436E